MAEEMQKFSEDIKRHFDVVAEDLASKIETVAEATAEIPGMKNSVDSIKEMVAKNTEDIEVMKMDIEAIKQGLRRKVDVEDFAMLEKRVTALEGRAQK